MRRAQMTVAPVESGDTSNHEPEFVRVPQLKPMAGLKRGIIYRKIADGTFKSVLMREPGNKSGIRLIYWPSVKAYLHGLMKEQANGIEQEAVQ